ncbi:hypothetical protein [Novipirellula artificiosorum]|uniref:Uncharacterized protein n=1 Tax=Novipirellula artificiosorum TaxID=2528016 RepID=A0A5C6D1V7_9BACT|nr:hypothetical protein [Novipirellula artificiosorum]TWU31163.1 hypothetical protein Poly41_63540 [Novipirellula artificiosorum]
MNRKHFMLSWRLALLLAVLAQASLLAADDARIACLRTVSLDALPQGIGASPRHASKAVPGCGSGVSIIGDAAIERIPPS